MISEILPPTPSIASVAADRLFKSYGEVAALSGVSFTLTGGRVCALVGPNGAGKSTLIAVMLGLRRPGSGTATFGGRRYEDLSRPIETVGAVIDGSRFHPKRSARNHLEVVACAARLSGTRVDEVLCATGLSDVARRPAGELSLGMRQRLRVACALIGHPEVLLLDEPTNGLDPVGRGWFREMIADFASRGGVVLIATHQLAEAELLADDALILSAGQLVVHAPLTALTRGGRVTIKTRRAVGHAHELTRLGRTAIADGDLLEITGMEPAAVGQLILDHGIVAEAMTVRHETLQDVVLRLTGANDGSRAPGSQAQEAVASGC